MSRGLTSAVTTELATKNINAIHLVNISLAGNNLAFTENSFPLTSSVSGSSTTYLSSGVLLDASNVTESQGVNVSRFSLTLTGVDQTYIALALQNNIIHDEVKIFRAFLNSSNSIIADPFLLYHGFINSFQIVDNNNTATIKFDLESYFANAGQVNGRITNDSTQQRFFANDKGFEYSDQIIKDLKWGNQS
jgi:hypothetical protein